MKTVKYGIDLDGTSLERFFAEPSDVLTEYEHLRRGYPGVTVGVVKITTLTECMPIPIYKLREMVSKNPSRK
jgi:hypothetical protein